MALSAGTRLGPYEILEPLGAGGMGEVYRARDPRLERDVAIKVLPEDVAGDRERLRRFEKEARAAGALNHPNVLAVHDVGAHDGRPYLVTELLEGDTLRERLTTTSLPAEKAVDFAVQVARGLAAAHDRGIVHRDLKPENLFVTRDGLVKILDFGLAKLRGPQAQPRGTGDDVETASRTTDTGAVIGTAGYMSPEQVRGRAVDHRSDIFSFGAVLYEMLSGRRAFQGDSGVEVLNAILKEDPPCISVSKGDLPPHLTHIVQRCLDKDPDGRFQSARDLAFDLEETLVEPMAAPAGTASSRAVPPVRRKAVRWGGALLAGILLGGAGLWALRRPAEAPRSVVRSLLEVQPAEDLNAGGFSGRGLPTPCGSRTALAWTPDGRALVFVGRREGVQQLYLRELHANEARPIPGTEQAQVPALSPDGEWVVFWAEGQIRKVRLVGGPPAVVVADISVPFGMSWGDEGELFLGHPDHSIWRVSPDEPAGPVTERREAEFAHSLPSLLPGGDALMFTVRRRERTWGDEVVVGQVLATGEREILVHDAADARYVSSGHLVFLRRGVLHAVAFDPVRLEAPGEPVPPLEGVAQALVSGNTSDITGAGHFSVAANGALAYVAGEDPSYPVTRIVALDRQGRVDALPAPPRRYSGPLSLSLALAINAVTGVTLSIYDLDHGTLTRLTHDGEAEWPRWSPDGERVAFWWRNTGGAEVAWQRADGSTLPERLASNAGIPSSWSPDWG